MTTSSFGAWSTAVHAPSDVELGMFWRRRLGLLAGLGQSTPGLSRRHFLGLTAASVTVCGLPTLRSGSMQPAGRRAAGENDAGDDPLELARQASVASSGLRSAIGTAQFEVHRQQQGEKEPILTTRAAVKVHFDQGKYHLHFDHETLLIPTVSLDETGQEKERRLAEWKPDDIVVIFDGTETYAITFSPRIRPTGCGGEIHPELSHACLDAGFSEAELARLGKEVLDVSALTKNLGREAIEMFPLPGGAYQGRFSVGNSHAEFAVSPEAGFNVTEYRVHSPTQKAPVQSYELSWKRADGTWYVQRFVEQWDNRAIEKEAGYFSRTIFTYDAFDVGVKVDPKLFTLASVEIPRGTRFLDRRPEAQHRIVYWDGSELTPNRVAR